MLPNTNQGLNIIYTPSKLDEHGNVIPNNSEFIVKLPNTGVEFPAGGEVASGFVNTTTVAVRDGITKMMESQAAGPIITYNRLIGGTFGLGIDYMTTYSHVKDQLGNDQLKVEIATGGVVAENLFFTKGISEVIIQSRIAGVIFKLVPFPVKAFIVTTGAALLVGYSSDIKINNVSIHSTIADIFGGAYDKLADLINGFKGSFEAKVPTFDNFVLGVRDGTNKLWQELSASITSISDSLSNSYHKFMDAVASALHRMDPLVIDMSGNGIALDSFQASNALFDLNGDGTKENTGWTKANGDDAFLVIDKNSDGKINDISELFGNADISGFAQLKQYDSNGDGVINASDSQFNLLKLWNDKNANGVVDTGEMTTLAQNNITAISVRSYSNPATIEGNLRTASSDVTFSNGTTRSINELYFGFADAQAQPINNNADASLPASFKLNIATIVLPYSRGYGSLYSWQAANDNCIDEMVNIAKVA